jgi:WD40 repeat protein
MATEIAAADDPDSAARTIERKTRVFVSYSRADLAFCDELVAALNARGFEAYLDKKDILPGEPWRERISALILVADAVLFVISPDSMRSEVCTWEVEETERLQKKLLPVVRRQVADSSVPQRLARLNYIFLRAEDDFEGSLVQLATAIDTDIDWIRQHTRMGELARRWEEAGRPASGGRLLRGEELSDAEKWLLTSAKSAPDPTEAQRAYIRASRAFETAEFEKERDQIARTRRFQRRSAWALAGVALLLLGLTANVIWQQRETDRREANILVNPVDRAAAEHRYDRVMRYALQALPPRGAAPWSPVSSELEAKLGGAALLNRLKVVMIGHAWGVSHADFSPDGGRIITASPDTTARVWEAGTGKPILVLAGHELALTSAVYSHQGTHIATTSNDGTVRIWEAGSGRQLTLIRGHARQVESVDFSPDGRRIVTASTDRTARVWETGSGKQLAVLTGHTAAVTTAKYSPDGLRIATAAAELAGLSSDNTARVWDAATGKQIAVLAGHTNGVVDIAFSSDGTRVVTAAADPSGRSSDHTARIWDAATGRQIAVLTGHTDAAVSARFSPDGRQIVTASRDNTARLWDGVTGKELTVLRGHSGPVRSACYSPDGKLIVTASNDATARLWDSATGGEIAVLAGHNAAVSSAKFSPDGAHVLTTSDDATARIWSIAASQPPVITKQTELVSSVGFSPDGTLIVLTVGKAAHVLDAKSGREIAVLTGHTDAVSQAAFSRDGTRIVTASADKTARVWEVPSGRQIAVLAGHAGSVLDAAFDAEGLRIVTASDDRTARIWLAGTRKQIAILEGHSGEVTSAAFSMDGRRIVTSDEEAARLWDAATTARLSVILVPTEKRGVSRAALSPDGSRVVTAGHNTARLWDAATGNEVATLAGHHRDVTTVEFSRDGSRILTSGDRTARVWDAQTGSAAAVLEHPGPGYVVSAAFSPDARHIVTGSDDGTVRIWEVSWVTKVHGVELRNRVCAEKLVGTLQEFTTQELEDPILRGINRNDAADRNPCLRRGPLHYEYYTQAAVRWGRWIAEMGQRLTSGTVLVATPSRP